MRLEGVRPQVIAAALGTVLLLGGQAPSPALQAAGRAVPGTPGPTAAGAPVHPHRLSPGPRAAGPQAARVVPRRQPVELAAFGRLKARANAAAEREAAPDNEPAPVPERRGPAGDPVRDPAEEEEEQEEQAARASGSGVALATTFPTLDYYDSANGGYLWNPPDGALAVGPTSLLAAVNQALAVYDRSGARLLGPVGFNTFFGTADFPFDPRALYDAGNAAAGGYGGGRGRFALLATTGGSYTLAVSQHERPEDPQAGWCRYLLNAVIGAGSSATYADFPGLGMDGDNLYITSNQYSTDGIVAYARLLVVPKASVYPDATTGACPTATSTDFPDLRQPDGSRAFTVQPAHQPDALPGKASATKPGVMYLVNALFPSGDALVARSVTTVPSARPGVTTPTLNAPAWIGAGPYDLPASARQPGAHGRFIDTGDTRLWAGATYRYGRIYTANTTRTVRGRPFAANPYANTLWYEITPTSPTTFESPARTHAVTNRRVAYFFPGVMPGCPGTTTTAADGLAQCSTAPFAGLEVSGSGPLRPASAYAVRARGDRATVRRYQPGVPGYELNARWGDYPGLSADPTDAKVVWVLGEYAKATNAWGTAVTAITPR